MFITRKLLLLLPNALDTICDWYSSHPLPEGGKPKPIFTSRWGGRHTLWLCMKQSDGEGGGSFLTVPLSFAAHLLSYYSDVILIFQTFWKDFSEAL